MIVQPTQGPREVNRVGLTKCRLLPVFLEQRTSSDRPGTSQGCRQYRKPDNSLHQLIGAADPHFRIAKKAPISGAGDLISTTTESSMASNPWRTPLGCRQTSPDPMMNSSEPTVDFTLPFTTYAINSCV